MGTFITSNILSEGGITGTTISATTISSTSISGDTLYGDGSNLTNVTSTSILNTQNVLWVDSVFGNDSTALPNRGDRPYLTIGSALTSTTTTGSTVFVRPGNYLEEGLVVNENVSLVSEGGWQVTTIGTTPVSATSDIIELKENSYIEGFSVNVPQGSFNGIFASNAAGTNSAYNITFYGNGTTGSTGVGMYKSGGGKLIGTGIRVEGGGMNTCLKVDSGVLALEGVHVPQSSGSIENVLLVTTSGGTLAGRAQMISFNSGNDNVTNACRIYGGSSGVTPTCLVFTANVFNATNAISTNGDYHVVSYLGGRIENVDYALNVDLSGTGVDSVFRITSNHQPDYIYPPAVAYTADFGLDFSQEDTDRFVSSKNLFGLDKMTVGISERGTETFLGKGAPYGTGMVVLTTDNTTTPTGDGGNFIDVSEEAKSFKRSTLTFQTGGTGTSILITTTRVSVDLSTTLKFFGVQFDILSKTEGGSYIFEFWDGSNWVEDLYQVHSENFGYNYGKTLFIRSQSEEHVSLNLDKDIEDTWSAKTINGITGYWVRCRMTSSASTTPVLEQIQISESSTQITREGILQFNGKSIYKTSVDLVGGQWGVGTGTLTDLNVTVGSGSTPTDTWSHELRTSKYSADGEAATFTMKIPKGVSTAQKVNVFADYILDGANADTTPANMIFSFLPVEVTNVLIADSEGSKIPVPRPLTATTEYNTYPAQVNTISTDVGSNKVHNINLGKFDISDYYNDDMIFMRLEKDSGVNVDFNLVNFYVDFDMWTLGNQADPATLETTTIFSEDWADRGVSNGWVTVQDGAETNLWAISTGTSRSNIYSAYITDDLGVSDVYQYDINNTQGGAHLYVDFSIPANARNLTVKFYWTCLAENGSTLTRWDYGRVGISPTSYTPTANSEITTTYQVGADSNLNKFNVGYNGGASSGNWTLETIAVPSGLWVAGTDARLILMWKNDSNTGTQPPFAVDDITIEVESLQ